MEQIEGLRGRPEGLNESQKVACEAAISQRLTLIQGPLVPVKPTAVRILQSWSSQNAGTILAVADSNVAVDNLLEEVTWSRCKCG